MRRRAVTKTVKNRGSLNNVELAEAEAVPGEWRAEVRAAALAEGSQRLSIAGNVSFDCLEEE